MTTTIVEFEAAIAGCSPSGVEREYDETPTSLDTADLPASFLGDGSSGLSSQMTTCRTGEKIRMVEFVVAIGPVAQDTQSANRVAQNTMSDAVEAALDAVSLDGLTTYGLTYEIRRDSSIVVAGINYWGVSATVEGVD